MFARALIVVGLLVVLCVPLLLRPAQEIERDPDAPRLIIITPHVEQITDEFAAAFDRWHRREYGTGVQLDVRRPGGTSEIIRQLQAQFEAAIRDGGADEAAIRDGRAFLPAGTISFDLMFGGGSYDHGRLKNNGPTITIEGADVLVPLSAPATFSQSRLDGWFGENVLGSAPIYDPEQYWIGVACSSFGIVYNRDVFARLDLETPASFGDLTDPALIGWVALADPRQSGSITTTFDSILNNEAALRAGADPGDAASWNWDEGWRILRAMSANTRYFTNSSTKPPIDVSQGEAAAGLAIDFYGRAQAQSVRRPGESPGESRVGYADPAGSVFIDPDPISLLNGAPNPELAERFIEFALTDEGQALWQLRARHLADGSPNEAAQNNPLGPDGVALGPAQYELRRLPVRRAFIERHRASFIDDVDPFEIASDVESRGWRSSIAVMMGAFGIDTDEECRRAWRVLHRTKDVAPETKSQAEAIFFAFPTGEQVRETWARLFPDETVPEEACVDFSPATYRQVRNTWRDGRVKARLEIVYAEIFKENYERVVSLMRE